MRISVAGLSLIQQFEGYRSNLYLDAAGLLTIGYGHLVHAFENERYVNGITQVQAEALLRADIGIAENAVLRFIRAPLRQHQFDALVSFTYNVGGAALERSTLRRQLNRGEYDDVPRQFLRYIWAGGKQLSGLVKRRKAEAELFAT